MARVSKKVSAAQREAEKRTAPCLENCNLRTIV